MSLGEGDYNGWRNWHTWAINLHAENEERYHKRIWEQVRALAEPGVSEERRHAAQRAIMQVWLDAHRWARIRYGEGDDIDLRQVDWAELWEHIDSKVADHTRYEAWRATQKAS